MRNRVVGTIGRVHKRQAKKANGEICVIVDDLPIVINMSLVRNMTAHETLFCKHNPHVCIVWHDGKYTNIPMESYEDAENFIRDAYNRCRTYNYV
jgi:hypothetical protein